MQLPQGWSQKVLEDCSGWTQSQNFIISVTVIRLQKRTNSLHLDSNEESWSHSESVEVLVLPEPVVVCRLKLKARLDQYFRSRETPIGVPINYT